MKRKLVRVTAEHIARGWRYRSECCPLALALTGALGTASYVGSCHFYLIGRGAAKLPAKAVHFRRSFDLGNPVKPFSFYVSL